MSCFVYCYNILSTRLVDPGFHDKCKPEFLKTQHRWNLIKQQLDSQLRTNSIICLQELSEEWLSILIIYFNKYNYTFIYDSQWLGVGIAYPRDKFDLEKVDFVCIGETIKEGCVARKIPKSSGLALFLTNMVNYFISFLPSWLYKPVVKKLDVWEQAIKKTNRVVRLQLQDTTHRVSFNVINYHMPCEFRNPNLMNIHAHTLLSTVQKLSGEVPYILAGDFNSLPNSVVYRMITEGKTPALPPSETYEKLPVLGNVIPLKSGYAVVRGKEPQYTNFSYPRIADSAFRDTIDYIFCSNQLKPTSALEVNNNHSNDIKHTFPNEIEGSDHLPIGVKFEYPKSY